MSPHNHGSPLWAITKFEKANECQEDVENDGFVERARVWADKKQS